METIYEKGFTTEKDSDNVVIQIEGDNSNINNSVEAIRKCVSQFNIDNSWDQTYYVSFKEAKDCKANKTPPFVSIMITDDSPTRKRENCSTQTESKLDNSIDVNFSLCKDFPSEESLTYDNLKKSLSNKRYRRDTYGDNEEIHPTKKTKNSMINSTSSSSDSTELEQIELDSEASSRLCSESEASFKSINSNYSFKTRKRRLKSDSNLIRDVLKRTKKNSSLTKHNFSDNNTPGN